MQNLKIDISNESIGSYVVDNAKNGVQIVFSGIPDSWSEVILYASFVKDSKNPIVEVIDNTANIPDEILEDGTDFYVILSAIEYETRKLVGCSNPILVTVDTPNNEGMDINGLIKLISSLGTLEKRLSKVAISGNYNDLENTLVIDQIYNSKSENAQSGRAVEGAIMEAKEAMRVWKTVIVDNETEIDALSKFYNYHVYKRTWEADGRESYPNFVCHIISHYSNDGANKIGGCVQLSINEDGLIKYRVGYSTDPILGAWTEWKTYATLNDIPSISSLREELIDQSYNANSENAQSGKAVAEAIAKLVNGSPEALDTLHELAEALGNDENFSATVMGQIGKKADKTSLEEAESNIARLLDGRASAGKAIRDSKGNYIHTFYATKEEIFNKLTLQKYYGDMGIVPTDSSLFEFDGFNENDLSVEICGFSETNDIEELVIPYEYKKDGITYRVSLIAPNAFENNTFFKTVVIPNSVDIVADCAFKGCTSLEKTVFPKGIKEIWEAAFGNCTNLKTIAIPTTITTIYEKAFDGSGLTDVYYEGTKEQWESINISEDNETFLNATIHFSWVAVDKYVTNEKLPPIVDLGIIESSKVDEMNKEGVYLYQTSTWSGANQTIIYDTPEILTVRRITYTSSTSNPRIEVEQCRIRSNMTRKSTWDYELVNNTPENLTIREGGWSAWEDRYTKEITTIKNNIGDIGAALDDIITIQNGILGGGVNE